MEEIRYGLLVPGTTLPRWQVDVLDHLDALGGVRPVLLVVDAGAGGPRPSARDLWRRRRLAWTLFNRWSATGARSLEPVDLGGRLGSLPRVEVTVRTEGYWQEFPDADVEAVRSHHPDLLLRFGFNMIRGGILDVAPLGVWSYHHDDERVHRGGPPCFWELAHGDEVTGVLLQRLTDRLDGGVPLARARFATVPHSYRRNRDQAYLGAADLPAQVCGRILAGDPRALSAAPSG
jgi:hypothetical protein